jgi:hypothetical protein
MRSVSGHGKAAHHFGGRLSFESAFAGQVNVLCDLCELKRESFSHSFLFPFSLCTLFSLSHIFLITKERNHILLLLSFVFRFYL